MEVLSLIISTASLAAAIASLILQIADHHENTKNDRPSSK